MATKKNTEKRIVVVRSRDSGVWIGELIEQPEPSVVRLQGALKIWRWRGANTTSEIALDGALDKSYSRIAKPVTVTVTGCCEVIESSASAYSGVSACGWAP